MAAASTVHCDWREDGDGEQGGHSKVARCVGEGGPGDMNLRVAFDVDGTLIDDQDNPRWEVIDLLRALHACVATIGIWSGGGADYARHWKERLNLREFVSWQAAKDSAPAPLL